MVQSGTVRATVSGAGAIEVEVSVTPRGWSTQPAAPEQVDNGQLSFMLPVPPGPALGYDVILGYAEALIGWQWVYETIGSGPNSGYVYYSSANHPESSYWFKYIIHPDLENEASEFSQHQCGRNGWIPHSDLLTQTHRHEYNSATQSHYAFYSLAINSDANNLLGFMESRVGKPGSDVNEFNQETTSGLNSRGSNILAEMMQEPYAPNLDENGNHLGNVNIGPPYGSCN